MQPSVSVLLSALLAGGLTGLRGVAAGTGVHPEPPSATELGVTELYSRG